MNEYESIALQVAAGIGLAAAAGVRAFLPLFVVDIAARMDCCKPATATAAVVT